MEIKLRLKDVLTANHAFAQCSSVKEVKTRWNIVKNKRLLQVQADDYEEVRVKLVLELSPENKDISKEPAPVQEDFRVKTNVLLNSEVSSQGMLALEKKHVMDANLPLPVLEAIYPFILDDEAPAA